MNNVSELERQAMNLPPHEREQLTLAIWRSLERLSGIDPEGIEIALARDADIATNALEPISHDEFRRRTNGDG